MSSMYFAIVASLAVVSPDTLSTDEHHENRQVWLSRRHPGGARTSRDRRASVLSPVVRKLERQALVVLLDEGHGLLEGVLALARYPQLIALDLSLDLEAGLADGLRHRFGLVLWDALHQGALDAVGAAAGGLGVIRVQRLERHRAAHQLLLEDVQGGERPLVGLGDDHHRLARPVDRGPGVLEVEALGQLFLGLVQRVVDLLPVDMGDHVEGGIGHVAAVLSARATWRDSQANKPRPDLPGARGNWVVSPGGASLSSAAHGRVPERPKGAVCKIAGLRLPRFESWSCHTPSDLRKRGYPPHYGTLRGGQISLHFRSAGRGADADRGTLPERVRLSLAAQGPVCRVLRTQASGSVLIGVAGCTRPSC